MSYEVVASGGDLNPLSEPGTSAALAGVCCLVVEDEPLVSRGLVQMLRRAGASAEVASTVGEGCLLVQQRNFELVLLDLNLHGENGIAVASAARGLPSPPLVFVITGDASYLDLAALEKLGTKVLMKVAIDGDLPGMLRAALEHKRAATLPPHLRVEARVLQGVKITRATVELSAKERLFLERLEAGEVFSIEAVAREILGRGSANIGNANAAQKFVSRLRRKLSELGEQDRVIECVYGAGYRARRSA